MKDKVIILGKWEDDLCWCPSQCYLKLEYLGQVFNIYLRWRWQDPWTAYLESGSFSHTLNVGFFKDTQLEDLKKAALSESKRVLYSKEHLLSKSKNEDKRLSEKEHKAILRDKKINKIIK